MLLGFPQAVYTLEGCETAAQVAEEAKRAQFLAPLAVVGSIVGSWLVGLAYMLALLSSVQNIASVQATTYLCNPHCTALLRCRGRKTHSHVLGGGWVSSIHGFGHCLHCEFATLLRSRTRQRFPCKGPVYGDKPLPSAIVGRLDVGSGWLHHLLRLHRFCSRFQCDPVLCRHSGDA